MIEKICEEESDVYFAFVLTVDYRNRMAHKCSTLLTKTLLHHNVRDPSASRA